jgi:2,7-dihydroxy-5-methyl-1-naphthoate 7-O-methyltransferase
MAEDQADREEADLGQLLDLQTPWCLHVAATLRLPEHIQAGHRDIGDLAAAAGCDRDALHAMLGYLVTKGVFREESPGRFACNHAAEQLADSARFLDLDGIGGRMAHAWGTMLGYVRTGKPAYQEAFGLPFWDDLAAHPDVAADFDALMGPAGHGIPDYEIELTGGWDRVRSVVDVGGGTGAMLISLLRRHPLVRGTLVDLPATVARADLARADLARADLARADLARADLARADLADVADRVTISGQSFFDPLPAGADLYLLKNVLNDWPDAETVAILRCCREAAGASGRIVVIGGVRPAAEQPVLAIDMLVAGGKTSTITQFTELARLAALTVLSAGEQASGRYVVELEGAKP